MLSPKDLQTYKNLLRRDVFRTTSRWPQFELLISNLSELASATPAGAHVVSIERNRLYGGRSLIRPIFQHCNYISIDSTPTHNAQRGAYNEPLLREISKLFGEELFRCESRHTDLSVLGSFECFSKVDLLIIPNLLHHVKSLPNFFSNIGMLLQEGAIGYIFDSTLREWHQIPDDYYRLTPWAVESELNSIGCSVSRTDTTGGPFDAIRYCWEQAIEYLPQVERARWQHWLEVEHQPELSELSKKFHRNLVREHTQFPTAYSVFFERRS